MKRTIGAEISSDTKKMKCSPCCSCLLDLTISSHLLSSKIADIPQKLKYQTIIAPIFEFCFGTSDLYSILDDRNPYSCGPIDIDDDEEDFKLNTLNIDWVRDETFIYSQLFQLNNIIKVAAKLALWDNRDFVLKCTDCYYKLEILSFLTEDFFTDREFVLKAVRNNGKNLEFASDELKNDREIVLEAINNYGCAIEHASDELRNDRDIVKLAIQQTGQAFYEVPEIYQSDKELILLALETSPDVYDLVCDELRNDRQVCLAVAKVNGGIISPDCFEEVRNDKEIVMLAVQQNPYVLESVSYELRNDREIMKMAVMKDAVCLRYGSEEIRDDKEIVKLALNSSPYPSFLVTSGIISERLRNDREFLGLEILPNELSNDREKALESIQIDPNNFMLASDELRKDREFVLEAVKICGAALEYVGEFEYDREIVLAAVTQNGNALIIPSDHVPAHSQYFSDKEIIMKAAETLDRFNHYRFWHLIIAKHFTNDREVIMHMVKFGFRLGYFSTKYQRDEEIVMEALKTQPAEVLKCCYPSIALNRVLAMRIVKQDGNLLGEMSATYRNDREIVSLAIKQNKNALKYASTFLKNDREILQLIQ